MSGRTQAGLRTFRPAGRGSRVILVAPASGTTREVVEAGAAELSRLGFEPVWDEDILLRSTFTAGSPEQRARAWLRAMLDDGADAVIAARGGYGSIEILPLIDVERVRESRTAFVGYSDVTAMHSVLGAREGLASVHGAMLEGRLAAGPEAYDPASFLAALSPEPLGELSPEGLESLIDGVADGPFVGGTLTQILASLETPFAFNPPPGHVLFLEDVGERPYRLHRMLTQLKLTGRLRFAVAVVFGEMPRCDEPGGAVRAKDTVRDALSDFPGPVLFGFPSGHATSPLVSVPLGVHVHVHGGPQPRLVFDEAAAAA